VEPEGANLKSIFDSFMDVKSRFTRNVEELASKQGLTKTQFLIVMDTVDHPGTTITELCRRCGLKKSAVSKVVDLLVDDGVLVRTQPKSNRRTVALTRGPAMTDGSLCSDTAIRNAFPGWKILEDEEKLSSILAGLRNLKLLTEKGE
jgi:predicted transcriptional regulator